MSNDRWRTEPRENCAFSEDIPPTPNGLIWCDRHGWFCTPWPGSRFERVAAEVRGEWENREAL